MDDKAILTAVKINLGISAAAYDERLQQLMIAAKQMIAREGITINAGAAEDDELVIMYTSYLWQKRKEDTGMPRMLRYALNNRLLSQKGTL